MSEPREIHPTPGASNDALDVSRSRSADPRNPPAFPESTPHPPLPPSADVSLLLRAHSEQRWLSHEVIPVLREIETPGHLPEEQLPAAAAYLEVIWAESLARARETDAALCQLEQLALVCEPLPARARRYHAAVSALRRAVARRVTPLIAAPAGTLAEEHPPREWVHRRDLIR
jgi:hypothetical protein